ncbi:MAG TPA: hypothetical protein PK404_04375 [Fervidobacterium sp.]|nr:hypothetical protein [Fervidobacterium sp.]
MYRNQKHQVRHLTKQEYVALKTLCRLSKNLYNATFITQPCMPFASTTLLRRNTYAMNLPTMY